MPPWVVPSSHEHHVHRPAIAAMGLSAQMGPSNMTLRAGLADREVMSTTPAANLFLFFRVCSDVAANGNPQPGRVRRAKVRSVPLRGHHEDVILRVRVRVRVRVHELVGYVCVRQRLPQQCPGVRSSVTRR